MLYETRRTIQVLKRCCHVYEIMLYIIGAIADAESSYAKPEFILPIPTVSYQCLCQKIFKPSHIVRI